MSAPPPNRGDAQRERTPAAVSGTSSEAAPSRSQAAVPASQRPSCAGLAATLRWPALRNQTSIPRPAPMRRSRRRSGGLLADCQRGAVAEGCGELVEPVPERVEEAGVAAARPDLQVRASSTAIRASGAPAKRPRGPQSGVATADDHNVGVVVAPRPGWGDRAPPHGPSSPACAHPSAPLGAASAADASSARCRVAMVAAAQRAARQLLDASQPVAQGVRVDPQGARRGHDAEVVLEVGGQRVEQRLVLAQRPQHLLDLGRDGVGRCAADEKAAEIEIGEVEKALAARRADPLDRELGVAQRGADLGGRVDLAPAADDDLRLLGDQLPSSSRSRAGSAS